MMSFPAVASNGDDITSSVGFVILSLTFTVFRIKKYLEGDMKDLVNEAANIKAPLIATMGGGALTFTSQNIISVFGLVVAVAGIVVSILQYRQSRRKNNLAERELNWKIEESKSATKEREVEENNQ